ncbi:MAG: TetR/AcrR family transcriptional regulator [Calditrichaeota bacterium]|nr:MAG: TetR/AcrR family transcriptional regulator [Calditrichota bacterium]
MMNYNTETEQKILSAAAEVFLEKGKGAARMQEIADRAGINKALLHYYFRSKERLYDEVFKRLVSDFFNELFDAIQDIEDIQLLLKAFIDNYIDLIAQRQRLIRFIIWEIETGGGKMVELLKTIMQERGLTTIPIEVKIQKAIQEGKIAPVDSRHLILSLIGMCIYPFIARPIVENIFQGIQVTSTEFLQQRKTEIFNLIWNGIKK